MTKKSLLPLLITGIISCSSIFSQELNIKKLDSFFDALSNNEKAMGSIAIAKNGTIVYKRSIGFSNIINNEKIGATDKTLYRIGSTTKMFTATMIFQLIEEHKISLSTKLSEFFPEIPNSKIINIETLLNHTNGLYDYVNDQKDFGWITKPQTTRTIVQEIVKGQPNSLPNEKFKYSNSGYFLLSKIIEKITKKTYNENLQRRICSKIQLKNTYSPLNNELKIGESSSFNFVNGKWEKMHDIYFPNVIGVGDILSTPIDLIKFDEALLEGKLISETSLKSMKTFINETFGMGIMKVPFYNRIGYGHVGDTYGTHTIVSNFTNDTLTFASCINGEAFPHNDISIGILSICFNEKYEIPTFKIFEVSTETLNKYLGIYSSKDMPLKISITQKDNALFAQATGQPAFPLEATEKDKFRFVQAGVIMEFNIDKNELIMKQGGGSYLFAKDK